MAFSGFMVVGDRDSAADAVMPAARPSTAPNAAVTKSFPVFVIVSFNPFVEDGVRKRVRGVDSREATQSARWRDGHHAAMQRKCLWVALQYVDIALHNVVSGVAHHGVRHADLCGE